MGQMATFKRESRSGGGCACVFLATPCFGGAEPAYVQSVVAATNALEREGIGFTLKLYSHNCHVDDSRNMLVRAFLESDCTDLVFLDADLGFAASDLMRLINHDADVVAGAYRLKQDGEEYTARELNGAPRWKSGDLMEVEGAGTGFMRIRRIVLERLAERATGYAAKGDAPGRAKVPVIFERTVGDGSRWGGDYTFCRKWRGLGGRVFVDPSMRFAHYGAVEYSGCYSAHMRRTSGEHMREEMLLLRAGKETADTMVDMCMIYGNETFAVMPDMLSALVLIAREATGRILECGSGLSTLAMAAANPSVEVWALEHNEYWHKAIVEQAAFYGLDNVKAILAPLRDYVAFEWYSLGWLSDPAMSFGMVVCDGPPRTTKGGRSGLQVVRDNITTGARMVFDDYGEELTDTIGVWGRTPFVSGVHRKFAIVTKSN